MKVIEFIKSSWVKIRRIFYLVPLPKANYYRWLKEEREEKENKDKDFLLKKRMSEIIAFFPVYGYLRVLKQLKREGYPDNHKRVHRIYQEMGLQRWKRNQKKVNSTSSTIGERDKKAILLKALNKNQVWATDFCEDQLINGKRFRIIAFLDIFTKEILNHEVDFSITGEEVIIAFESATLKHGKPLILRSDNGPEFISKSLNRYLNYERIKHETIDKGKPFQNGFIESFFDKRKMLMLKPSCFYYFGWS